MILDALFPQNSGTRVSGQARKANIIWWLWFIGIIGLAFVLAAMLLFFGPNTSFIGFAIYAVCLLAIVFRPRYGVYLVMFFALVGDPVMMRWYPFEKNFSSRESLFYLSDSVIVSPLEITLLFTYLAWFIRFGVQRKLRFRTGPLFGSVLAFTTFIIIGLVYGLGTGGNFTIGLWEARPILYLPLMYFLASNLLETRDHINHLMWFIMAALVIEGFVGLYYVAIELRWDVGSVEGISQHAAAIHINSLFVFIISAWIYHASPAKRLALLPFLPIVGFTYFSMQRRAAFVALALAFVFLGAVLRKQNRRIFNILLPSLMVMGILYLGVFWNAGGALGMPASTVKSLFFPGAASAKDVSSNVYRDLENVNASYTVHSAPIMGVGFGNKFYMIVELPDISVFEWWEYITHNSIVWIWMKAGIGGFFSLLFMIGSTIMLGTRVVWRLRDPDISVIALTSLIYIMMHFVYAYVDMSWDNQSMLFVGAMMAVLGKIETIVRESQKPAFKRWPWLADPDPLPELLPVRDEIK